MRRTVEVGRADIEDELGLTVTYDPLEPDDPTSCTVAEQDLFGQVEPGSDVTPRVVCAVPDVTTLDLATAETRGRVSRLEADPPIVDDPSVCEVVGQGPAGEAPPGEAIALDAECGYGEDGY